MKQIIMDVLKDISNDQINLASEAARETVSSLISAALKTKGSYKEYIDYELDEQEARASWECSICGKNTFEVDFDYSGSNYNHLGCELEVEMREKKHEDKVFGKPGKWREDIQGQIKSRGIIKPKKRVKKKWYEDMGDGHMLEVGKLAEEIVDNQNEKWIYESPDGGKTVFRRPFSDYDPKNKEEIDWETKEPTGRKFIDYPFKEVQIDGC